MRKFLPDFFLKQRDIILRLGPEAGRTYAKLCFLDAIGMRASNRRLAPASARSFLFVCYGNIMRSPMAEALMNEQLAHLGLHHQIVVTSAGLHAVPGREPHPWALEASAAMGVSLVQHRARALTGEMIASSDCIFVMDLQNKAEMLLLYPESRNKVHMLSAYAEGPRRYREIPDPYLGNLETTKSCYRELQTCVRNLTFSLSQTERERTQPAHH